MAKPHDTQDYQTWQEHPRVEELLAELPEIDDKLRIALRFYDIVAWPSYIDTLSQYESISICVTIKIKKGRSCMLPGFIMWLAGQSIKKGTRIMQDIGQSIAKAETAERFYHCLSRRSGQVVTRETESL